jgi:hypothetical protein
MKTNVIALSICLVSLVTAGCKKYAAGCMDTEAENYSSYAKLDDGSCMYHHSSNVTLSSWSYNDPMYMGSITWANLTQDVIDRGSISVFHVLTTGEIVELPYTISVSSSYSSHWFYEASAGKVDIFRWDSDLIDPGNPGAQTFKLSATW